METMLSHVVRSADPRRMEGERGAHTRQRVRIYQELYVTNLFEPGYKLYSHNINNASNMVQWYDQSLKCRRDACGTSARFTAHADKISGQLVSKVNLFRIG